MNILITGASGFLGRHTARYFASKGWGVYGLGHGIWEKEEYVRWGISNWVSAEVTTAALKEASIRPDAIIHCAGSGSVAACQNHPYEEFLRTVDGTAQVLEYIRTVNPESVFVYPSSAAVYGNSAILPIREDGVLNPVSVYGAYKKLAEELCLMYAQKFNIRGTIIRFFSIYGSELKKQLLWDACNKIKSGDTEFFGSGTETRDWVNVYDAVRLIDLAVKNSSAECPIVNGGTGTATAVSAVLTMIKEEMGLNGGISFNDVCRPSDPAHYQADVTRSLAWGWRSEVSLREGIAAYVKWFKESQS